MHTTHARVTSANPHGTAVAHAARRALRVAYGIACVGAVAVLAPSKASAHEEAPLPYPEPLETTPPVSAETMQNTPTLLYAGILVIGIGLMVSVFVVAGKRGSRRSNTDA